MSFILEALSKAEAEQDQGAAVQYTQTLPPQVKDNTVSQRLLIVLIVIAGSILMLGAYIAAQHFKTSIESQKPETPRATITNVAPQNQFVEPGVIRQKPELTPKTEGIVSNSLPDTSPTRTKKPSATITSNQKEGAYQTPSLHTMVSQESKTNLKTPVNNSLGTISEPTTEAAYVKYEIAPQIEEQKKDIQELPLSMHALSELDISVHMYSETPSKRFVYIKSVRYGEGAIISEGLILEEITNTGVVLNYHGTSYRLPVKM